MRSRDRDTVESKQDVASLHVHMGSMNEGIRYVAVWSLIKYVCGGKTWTECESAISLGYCHVGHLQNLLL